MLDAITKSIGKQPNRAKEFSNKLIEVRLDGESYMVGRERAIATWDRYAIILEMVIRGPNVKGISRLQVGKTAGVVWLDWNISRSRRTPR